MTDPPGHLWREKWTATRTTLTPPPVGLVTPTPSGQGTTEAAAVAGKAAFADLRVDIASTIGAQEYYQLSFTVPNPTNLNPKNLNHEA